MFSRNGIAHRERSRPEAACRFGWPRERMSVTYIRRDRRSVLTRAVITIRDGSWMTACARSGTGRVLVVGQWCSIDTRKRDKPTVASIQHPPHADGPRPADILRTTLRALRCCPQSDLACCVLWH